MEKLSPASAPNHSLALADSIVLIFYKTVSIWFILLQKVSWRFLPILRSHDDFCAAAPASKISAEGAAQPAAGSSREGLELTREEVEAVIEAMGIHAGGEPIKKGVAGAEVARLFDEKEPSLEEVEAAFQVFDEGRDGFIDAAELQRVLPKLGFREAAAPDACRQMIAAYDENGDGRIDFDEFVKFMENSLIC
ncbi:hypothetical protein Cni_G05537 [Canna indica]|uniref:EF-hand domain-containing protein n=1 Tax=Canna indica TaxID=4628 RepID=A0AAQ3JUW9_9LILI|nr:hypothetical protein Cni_G05537 [Canna indica]